MAETILPPEHEWDALTPTPGSVAWRRAGDARLFGAAGYALLLQVAHPTVGAGVTEHSEFRKDPWGRLLRTLDYTNTMVYGGPAAAADMGRRIREMHKHINGVGPDGQRYNALEPEAYAWVHATLAEAIIVANARFARPLTRPERERFWSEWRALGRMQGVRWRDLPERYDDFRAYVDRMVAVRLEHTAAVDDVLDALTAPQRPPLPPAVKRLWPVVGVSLSHLLALGTIGLLPPAVRARFGLRWSGLQELELRALGAASRAATPVLPRSLRNTGPGYLKMRRAALERRETASVERFRKPAAA